jgi:putative zinc finger/helix-turn-helix YgiT family protein
MKCECSRSEMSKSVETVHYADSGLEGVDLDGVTVWHCPACDESSFEIPRMGALHRAIARDLAERPAPLGPREIRFLRKHQGYSSQDFARRMGTTAETVSRWERRNDPMPMNERAQRLLRMIVLHEPPIEAYPEHETEEPAPSESPGEVHWHPTSRGWRKAS